jgi:hypothetical protein
MMSTLVAVLAVSLALNVIAVVTLFTQRVRSERASAAACEACPFVVSRPKVSRTTLPLLVDEPTTMWRLKAPPPRPADGEADGGVGGVLSLLLASPR